MQSARVGPVIPSSDARAVGSARGPAAPSAQWTESILVLVVGSVLIFALTRPAFDTYFFAENFVYLGQYQAHGKSFWRAIFSPTLDIFFRPVLCAASIPWHYLLPLDPFAYHCRNFVFCALNLLLLHRVLLRMTRSRSARVLAVLFFALSKIHLTTIGYINMFDAVVLLSLVLLTVLFLLRYLDQRRPLDYVLTLVFCVLTIFSKDYGLAVVGLMLALVAAREVGSSGWRVWTRQWAWRFVPVAAMTALYLGLRFAIVGAPPTAHLVYAPQLSLELTVRKLLFFTSTVGNLSFLRDGTDGANGLSAWLATFVPYPYTTQRGEAVLYVALLALLGATFWLGRRAGWRLLVPAAWVAAYLAPTMLTRNMQIYYYQEPLAGLAIALALCWEHLGRPWRRLWMLALVLIGLNGALGNPALEAHWATCAREAARIRRPVLEAHRGEPLESVTFVTSAIPFWSFTLTNSNTPMLQELMGLPQLQVRLIDHHELPARQAEANATNLFFDVDEEFALLPPIPRQTGGTDPRARDSDPRDDAARSSGHRPIDEVPPQRDGSGLASTGR